LAAHQYVVVCDVKGTVKAKLKLTYTTGLWELVV